MSSPPRRRITDRSSASPTFIGSGSMLRGDLICEGDLAVSGNAIGDASVRGAFTLSEESQWEGNIVAANGIVAGEITGNIMCSEKLEIRKSGRIHGAVRARTIAIAEGAVVDGEMSVTSDAPVIHFAEKRHL
jgi:cytoskeletal protein CcmA (bactofilin family)